MLDWLKKHQQQRPSKTALLLLGGGARNAYQIGVLRAISDQMGEHAAPFDIYCGTSAGAINVAMLANHADNFRHATLEAERCWADLSIDQVFQSGAMDSMFGLMRAALGGKTDAEALLDSSPLASLLKKHFDMDRIRQYIEDDILHGVSISTSSYTSSESVTFFDGHANIRPWNRVNQRAVRTRLTVDHLMASAAIPMIFPAVKLGDAYYGDGSMRLSTPLRSPMKMGADRILVISVANEENNPTPGAPGFGTLAAHMLDAMLSESIGADCERVEAVNHLLKLSPKPLSDNDGVHLKHIKTLIVKPSTNLVGMAKLSLDAFPGTLRWGMRQLGVGRPDGNSIASFLSFDKSLTRPLLKLGYADGLAQMDDIMELLSDPEKRLN